MATLNNFKCLECGKEFQFNYSEINSFSDLGIAFRYAPHTFSVKYPQCRKRTKYHVTDADKADNDSGQIVQ